MIKLRRPTVQHCIEAGRWREMVPETLRTPCLSSDDRQIQFYEGYMNGEMPNHKYYTIDDFGKLIGLGGVTNITCENRIGEISLILNPRYKHSGYGIKSVELLCDHAFGVLNLKTLCGECYYCNSATGFWQELVQKYNGYMTRLPNRKYWNGEYYDSMYFSIDSDKYYEYKKFKESNS